MTGVDYIESIRFYLDKIREAILVIEAFLAELEERRRT